MPSNDSAEARLPFSWPSRRAAVFYAAVALGGVSAWSCSPSRSGQGHDSALHADSTVDGSEGTDGGGGDGSEPWVDILEPADGALVENPVTFRVSAGSVSTVELSADGYSLGQPWDPSSVDTLTYEFSGVGYERSIELVGYDSSSGQVASDTITITVVEPDIGDYHGQMWNTYYYLAQEVDYPAPDDTTLYDEACNPIAEVPADYSDDVCIEGSGILEDGRVINYASTCSCGRECPTGGIVCYAELDPASFPYGMGSMGNPLEPLRSWAVDNDYIPFGTLLYAEQWDGVEIPMMDGLGGFIHDGCFRADDVGGWIQGNHFDLFAGTYEMYLTLDSIYPTGSDFAVYTNPGRCAYLAP
jgi:3D (Asp-Asp-Asp) domain-containing protein